MGYYMGDYSYPVGDRGVRGDPGFFSFLGRAVRGVTSLASSFMPGGSAISKVISHVPAPAQRLALGAGRAILKHPVLSAAGAAGTLSLGGAMLRHGKHVGLHPGVGMRRHRRMRVTNPKALRRAIRRTQGFAKLAMRTIHLVHPRKKARFGGFKKRVRRAA